MYILKYALKNIIRNPFISLSSLVVISLLVFFINILFFALFATDKVIASINSRLHIMITLEDGYKLEENRVTSMMSELEGRFPKMQIQYISQDEAFDVFRTRDPELAQLIEGVEENPLPNIVRLSNIPFDSYEAIQITIENYKDVLKYDQGKIDKKFVDFRSQYLRTSKLVDNLQLLKQGVYMILALFVFTVFVVVYTVISNTIFFLRDEMSIIELVGGRSYFIYGPLVIQAMFYTGLATIISVTVFYGIIYTLPVGIFSGELHNALTLFFENFIEYVPYGLVAMLLVGVMSALGASWKYIHKTIG